MSVTSKILKNKRLAILALAIILLSAICFLFFKVRPLNNYQGKIIMENEIILPHPQIKSPISVEEAILKRRSVREYKDELLNLEEVSQLLWAAQGITDSEKGFRTVPSAGALYPLEIYVTGKIQGTAEGVYQYYPENHSIIKIRDEDLREELSEAAYSQKYVSQAPLNIIITGVYERIAVKYGEEKAPRYTHLEAGHAAQNVYLQAQSLGLGTVAVGGFDIEKVAEALNLPDGEDPLYIMPVGRMR